jgi:hypothetical protein
MIRCDGIGHPGLPIDELARANLCRPRRGIDQLVADQMIERITGHAAQHCHGKVEAGDLSCACRAIAIDHVKLLDDLAG